MYRKLSLIASFMNCHCDLTTEDRFYYKLVNFIVLKRISFYGESN